MATSVPRNEVAPRNPQVAEVHDAVKNGTATARQLHDFRENISNLYVNAGKGEAERKALNGQLAALAKTLSDPETEKKAPNPDTVTALSALRDELHAPRKERNYLSVVQFDEDGERTVDGTVRATVHTVGSVVNDVAKSLHEKTGWNETGIKIGLYATGAGVAYWLFQELLDTKVGKAIAGAVAGTTGFSFLPESWRDSIKDGFFSILPESWVPFFGGEKWQMEKMKKTEKQAEDQAKVTDALIPLALPVTQPWRDSVPLGRGDETEVNVFKMVQSIETERALIKKIPAKRQGELNLPARLALLDATMLKFKPYLDARQAKKVAEANAVKTSAEAPENIPVATNLVGLNRDIIIGPYAVRILASESGKNVAVKINGVTWRLKIEALLSPTVQITGFQRRADGGGYDLSISVPWIPDVLSKKEKIPFDLVYKGIDEMARSSGVYAPPKPPESDKLGTFLSSLGKIEWHRE